MEESEYVVKRRLQVERFRCVLTDWMTAELEDGTPTHEILWLVWTQVGELAHHAHLTGVSLHNNETGKPESIEAFAIFGLLFGLAEPEDVPATAEERDQWMDYCRAVWAMRPRRNDATDAKQQEEDDAE